MNKIIASLDSEHIVAIFNQCVKDAFDDIVDAWISAPVFTIDDSGVFAVYDAIHSYEWMNTKKSELENSCKNALYTKMFELASDDVCYISHALDCITACDRAVNSFVGIVW